jgi:hypothetical protein
VQNQLTANEPWNVQGPAGALVERGVNFIRGAVSARPGAGAMKGMGALGGEGAGEGAAAGAEELAPLALAAL